MLPMQWWNKQLTFLLAWRGWGGSLLAIEQHGFKNVNNCLNTNIYYYLKTSGSQSSMLNLNVVPFFNTSVY
jgi:hypothetical protein